MHCIALHISGQVDARFAVRKCGRVHVSLPVDMYVSSIWNSHALTYIGRLGFSQSPSLPLSLARIQFGACMPAHACTCPRVRMSACPHRRRRQHRARTYPIKMSLPSVRLCDASCDIADENETTGPQNAWPRQQYMYSQH